jgi:hypothetical protein
VAGHLYAFLSFVPANLPTRALTDTFAGIAPAGVAAFILAQLAGMLAAVAPARWFWWRPMSVSGQNRDRAIPA